MLVLEMIKVLHPKVCASNPLLGQDVNVSPVDIFCALIQFIAPEPFSTLQKKQFRIEKSANSDLSQLQQCVVKGQQCRPGLKGELSFYCIPQCIFTRTVHHLLHHQKARRGGAEAVVDLESPGKDADCEM